MAAESLPAKAQRVYAEHARPETQKNRVGKHYRLWSTGALSRLASLLTALFGVSQASDSPPFGLERDRSETGFGQTRLGSDRLRDLRHRTRGTVTLILAQAESHFKEGWGCMPVVFLMG